jgi:SAM-dependent methyltransferase
MTSIGAALYSTAQIEAPYAIMGGMAQAEREFMPALRFGALTRLFDPVIAIYGREGEFKRRVLRQVTLAPGERVLDLGCGTGTLALMAAERAPGIEIDGLDADPEILARARSKTRRASVSIRFSEGFSTDLPYPDGSFDVVLSTLFFHHLEDGDKLVTAREIERVLKPGGRMVVGDVGRPQDRLMHLAVATTVQVLDGRTTTQLNVDGRLPDVFGRAGLHDVAVVDRLRTPIGTLDVTAGRKG